MGAKKEREKQLAFELFMSTDMLEKDIARQVSVSPQTMSRWVKEGSWDVLKATKAITPNEALRNAMQLYVLTSRELLEKKRAGEETGAIGDELMKISKSMEGFKTATPLQAYVQVLEEFMDFIPRQDAKFKQKLARYQEEFLRKKAHIE